MPELAASPDSIIGRVLEHKIVELGRRPKDEELIKLVTSYDGRIVGQGAECVVLEHPYDESKVSAFSLSGVLAIDYGGMNPKVAKEVFYLQRIFSTLFPHNFPHFYAAFGRHEDQPAGTIREKVQGESVLEIPLKGEDFESSGRVRFPWKFVEEAIREMVLAAVSLDTSNTRDNENLMLGKDGGVYYLDTIKVSGNFPWDLKRVQAFLDRNDHDGKPLYSPLDKTIVLKSVDRLFGLGIIDIYNDISPVANESGVKMAATSGS